MSNQFSRRYFFYGTLLAGAVPAGGFGSVPSLRALGYKSFLDKLNIAGIGMGIRGTQVISELAVSENIVALCDVNEPYSAKAFATYPKAAKYKDFRRLLDAENKNIDAVVVATPDHGHAPVALAAMQHGKHVYCEKPLTRTVWESRLLRKAASKYKVATQMGNQGFSHEGTRTCCEILWAGDIGSVREVHSWTGLIYAGMPAFTGAPPEEPIPDGLDWDMWLGPAAPRPYNREMFTRWRSFLDFGSGGSLGDWIVHCIGPAHLALQLDLAPPTSVECVSLTGKNDWMWPLSAHLRYEFPARGAMPPVTINIYQNMRGDVKYPEGMAEGEPLLPPMNNLAERGRYAPPPPRRQAPPASRGQMPGAGAGQAARGPMPGAGAAGRGGQQGPPAGAPGGGRGGAARVPGNGTLFVGDKGYMATTSRGEGVWLLPASRWKEYELPPQILPRSVSHSHDWVRACKGGTPGCSNFDIAAPFMEWLLLGAVALRTPGKLLWDAKNLRFTNSAEANKYVQPFLRKGWDLKL